MSGGVHSENVRTFDSKQTDGRIQICSCFTVNERLFFLCLKMGDE